MRECLVDDDGPGAGRHVALMERSPGDHRPIEGLEESWCHRRRPKSTAVGRLAAGGRLDFCESFRPGAHWLVGVGHRDDAGLLGRCAWRAPRNFGRVAPRTPARSPPRLLDSPRCERRGPARRLGNRRRYCTLRVVWLTLSRAAGMPMAVRATWTIIAPVQTRPKRSVAPPLPRFARCGCTRARVTLTMAGQAAQPVRREEPQGVPPFASPRVRDLAAFEDDVVDRQRTEVVASGEAGVSRADDDRRDALDARRS